MGEVLLPAARVTYRPGQKHQYLEEESQCRRQKQKKEKEQAEQWLHRGLQRRRQLLPCVMAGARMVRKAPT